MTKEIKLQDLNDDIVRKYVLIRRIHNAITDMSGKFKFIESDHHYETEGGTWLQGVSTVSSIVPKEWLAAWGAKEAVKALGYTDYPDSEEDAKFARENIDLISEFKDIKHVEGEEDEYVFDVKGYVKFLKDAKGASKDKSKKALLDGTAGHAWLEGYVKAAMINKDVQILDKNLIRPLEQFKDWAEKNVDCWILSEAPVAYIAKGYAGTLDAMALMKDGKLALIDFKFASHISEEYYLQTAGYQATFEPYDIKVDERIIIRLPKTLEKEEWDKEKHVYQMVPNNIEVHIVPTDYEMDKNVFFNCLPVKEWINKVCIYNNKDK